MDPGSVPPGDNAPEIRLYCRHKLKRGQAQHQLSSFAAPFRVKRPAWALAHTGNLSTVWALLRRLEICRFRTARIGLYVECYALTLFEGAQSGSF